ncbi:MAG: hypothetical protein QOD57_3075 [Actinomycetota bacterium]|nr:hypothetical protein [Actinomycetota bacterium]
MTTHAPTVTSPSPAADDELYLVPTGPIPARPIARMNQRRRPGPSAPLLGLLVALDLSALVSAWIAAFVIFGAPGGAWHAGLRVVTAVAVSLVLARVEGLYRPGIGSVRTVELAGVMRVISHGALLSLAVPLLAGTKPDLAFVATGSLLAFVLVSLGRGLHGAWLRSERSRGGLMESVVVVGYHEEAERLVKLLANHPELGLRVCALASDGETAGQHNIPWLGQPHLAVDAILRSEATTAIVSTAGMSPSEYNRVIHQLVQGGMPVQLSSGLHKVAHERLRRVALASEPFFLLEPSGPSRAQLALKRALDMVVASAALIVTLPLLALAALAVKLQDRGPILFRQTRVGQFGREFTVLKFRTMVIDADSRLADLRAQNERDGPLFKVTSDPRVTRVGKLLRASSLDELPQLFNVLAGSMSLVGPRPALPAEVATFDDALLRRHDMPPGITGLWQVDCRDNSSFEAYRHLDLFYIENWSCSLDLLLLWATIPAVLIRGVRSAMDRKTAGAAAQPGAEEFGVQDATAAMVAS